MSAMSELRRISIVTPSFNQGQFLEETIDSILSQGYPELEYIIIDGGSTDNSVEIIRKYAKHLAWWVSEKDRGQSHAINKGLARCTGEIFNWINSDDLLCPGALHAVAEAWRRTPGRIIAGNVEQFDGRGVRAIVRAGGQTLRNFVRFWEAEGFGWNQQGTFAPTAALKAIGGVREDLRYCMDYHMMVRLLQEGVKVCYVERTLGRYRFHSASKTVAETSKFRLERVTMLRGVADLGVTVWPWEWEAEQARRLLDVGKGMMRSGDLLGGIRHVFKAMQTSPRGAVEEIARRAMAKALRWTGCNG